MKVIVVGGGVIGTAIALELARPDTEVVVVERTHPGAEASSSAAGMLAPQLEASGPGPMLELMLRSRTSYPAWAERLSGESGVDVGYRACGALQVAFSADEAHHLEAAVAWQKASGLRSTLLTGDEARALEPALSEQVVAAIHLPDDHQLEPRKLMAALQACAQHRGIVFHRGLVRALLTDGRRALGVELEDGSRPADVVVLAAGAWAPLVPGVSLGPQAVTPARGQLVELSLPAPPLRHIVKAGLGYLVPRGDGRVVCGTTVELAGFDARVTAGGLRSVLSSAVTLCPMLADATVSSSWAGLRPWTPDGLPLLGPGGVDGLFVASGHGRNGVLLAPITARLIGQLVRGERPAMGLDAFHPGRFA